MSRSRENRISVALCTYNGQRFLSRQLASIQQQTRLPDELVVSDDRSSDNTLEILRSFAATSSFPVRIELNERNLGVAANFERTIQRCNGDLIALSDQDDIWYPHRLALSEQEFAKYPEVGLIFSDADVIDDQDQPLGITLWANFGFAGKRKQRLLSGDYTVLVKNRFVTGATVMFRSRLRQNFLPIGSGWLHDEWIAAIVAAVADVKPIESPLIGYRKHAAQEIGLGPRLGVRERHKQHWSVLSRHIGSLQAMCSSLSQQPLSQQGQALLACYQGHLHFARLRCALPQGRLRRLSAIFKDYPSYFACGSGVRSMAADLLLPK